MEEDFLTLHTSLAPDALKEKLRLWEPWSHRVDFDNGVSTLQCVKRAPFSEAPLRKFRDADLAVPFGQLAGGRLLDIGCNAGYNSINAALKHQFAATGIDVIPSGSPVTSGQECLCVRKHLRVYRSFSLRSR